MPWPSGHKAQTRERIIQAAAEAFLARGVSGVRIEELMAGAGLTHGGFYAHFKSKEELVGPALERASARTLEMLSSVAGARGEEGRFLAAADAYLSPAHVAHPERGCPVAALGAEVARSGGSTGRALARGIQERLAWMAELLPRGRSRSEGEEQDRVIGALACMVGGVILGRAVGGEESAAILAACRRFLRLTLEEVSAPASGPAPRRSSGRSRGRARPGHPSSARRRSGRPPGRSGRRRRARPGSPARR
jgi:TetR/AcrR family transcriptional repressor of nem operon